MQVTDTYKEKADSIVALFATTFAQSEGDAEGRIIGELARNILSNTPDEDIFVFSANDDGGALIGVIAFTRLTFPDDRGRFSFFLPWQWRPLIRARELDRS